MLALVIFNHELLKCGNFHVSDILKSDSVPVNCMKYGVLFFYHFCKDVKMILFFSIRNIIKSHINILLLF